MNLTTAIQMYLMELELPADVSLDDLVLDTQEFAMEKIIESAAEKLSEEDVLALDDMIMREASVQELDTWFATKLPDYSTYVDQAMQDVKEYLRTDDLDEEEATEEGENI